MVENRISAALTQADVDAILAAIKIIKEKLPFLINLTMEERRALNKPGDRSRNFIDKALEVAVQNPDILPRLFNLEEMRKDIELGQKLQPILLALSQLQEVVDNTAAVINSEAYAAALTVYGYAKAAGKAAALQEALDELGKRFSRRPAHATPKTPAKKTPME
ncbi:MAG TPA: hypothetical protein PLD20_33580 [Blastocatellia bacterium]|nr:hypothetical protein [Blastocatellia bacterium]HMV87985.1 hypothetical protein [Blastocatellia bacterium]HMX30412.1 hypothetical protein [Blastocatellia bacterium]HMY74516.1 hypothetical protein [Blastocatellia bacterium]HMZ22905.1 hypothetical protein [Blastocatellia bacterium]